MTKTTDPFERVSCRKDRGSISVHTASAFSRHKGLVNVIANDPGTGQVKELCQEGARD
jgi:hypothetical protein